MLGAILPPVPSSVDPDEKCRKVEVVEKVPTTLGVFGQSLIYGLRMLVSLFTDGTVVS